MQEALIDAIMAGNVHAVQQLLEQGACPNTALDAANVTPLHYAAQQDDARIAKMLLERGAQKHALTQPDQQAPKDIATLYANTAVLALL